MKNISLCVKISDCPETLEEARRMIDEQQEMLSKNREALRGMRDALRFYADPQSYGLGGGSIQRVIVDSGAIARGALRPLDNAAVRHAAQDSNPQS